MLEERNNRKHEAEREKKKKKKKGIRIGLGHSDFVVLSASRHYDFCHASPTGTTRSIRSGGDARPSRARKALIRQKTHVPSLSVK